MSFMNNFASALTSRAAIAFGLTLAFLPGSMNTMMAQGAAAPAGSKPQRVRTQLDGFDLSPKAGKSANQIGGASRDLGTPKLYAPNMGKAYTTNPEFHWAAAETGEKVTFRLQTAAGQTVYETATTADRLRYPGDAPALMPGATYKWTIVPENDVLGGPPAPVSFMIVTGADREAILNDLKQANDANSTAAVFVKHRIWYDAIQGYTDLIARTPNDMTARAARGELYDQLPATKNLADADWRMVH
jgi:hypothetical protein